jgi:hypothetical protein
MASSLIVLGSILASSRNLTTVGRIRSDCPSPIGTSRFRAPALPLFYRWVFARNSQNPPDIDHAFTIGLEALDRCSPSWGQSQHFGRIDGPGKMIAPFHLSGIEQRDSLICDRINCRNFVVFAVIAGMAR